MSYLPPELVDVIIDFLHDEPRALKNCALVSRSWLLSSRYHLFHTYTITDRLKAQNSIIFFKIAPDVAAHIRNLEVKRGFDHFIEFTELVGILHALPSLRSLAISEISLGKPEPRQNTLVPEPIPANPAFETLEKLMVNTCNITTYEFGLLFRLLGLFSEIRRVELRQRSIARMSPNNATFQAVAPPYHTSIVHLLVHNIPIPVVANLVRRTRTADTLQTLEFDDDKLEWADAEDLGAIFSDIGPRRTLRRLVLGPLDKLVHTSPRMLDSHAAGQVVRWDALQLSRCDALEEFTLRTSMILETHAELIKTLPATVKTVALTFVWLGRPPLLDQCQWGALDAALSEARFHDLRLVLESTKTHNKQYMAYWYYIEAHVRDSMPQMCSQGMLIVVGSAEGF